MSTTELDASASASASSPVPKYGGYHKPKGYGVGPFGPLGTILLLGVAFIVILMLPLFGAITAFVFGLLGVGFLLLLAMKDRHHQSVLDRFQDRYFFKKAKKNDTVSYLPGSLTFIGSHRLPGACASSKLHTWTDKDGNPFTILEYPKTKIFVINIIAEPDGASLIDPDELTLQVDHYGRWISDLAYESEDLKQAAVCLESSQGTGPGLKLEMSANASDKASPLSKEWAAQAVKTYPKGTTSVRCYITLSFKAPDPGLDLNGDKIKGQSGLEAIGRLVADRLPSLLESLPETGAGEVEAAQEAHLTEATVCAYNPDMREAYDECAARGQQPPVMLWDNVGPNGSTAHWNYYQHGTSAASITWETTGFISTTVVSKVLMPILEPTPDVSKRITWLYQPIPPEQAGIMAETDHRAAEGRVRNSKKPTARQMRQRQEAETARNNEADGNALLNFAILVTATVDDTAKIPAARATIKRQGPTARLLLRECNGIQDSAFTQGCGWLGLVTSEHLSLTNSILSGV